MTNMSLSMSLRKFGRNWQIEYTIKGFEEVGIFPFNPQNVKKGKLAPASIYK